jgi:predicted flap endonuclease-1-like 5' DNA nuclease
MGYLLTEIALYLFIAGLIGFAFGWAVKAGALDKYFDKLIELLEKIKKAFKAYYLTLTTTKKVLQEEKSDVKEVTKEEVIEETVPEVTKEAKTEVSISSEKKTETVETLDEEPKPVLLTEAPKAGTDKLSSIKGIGPVLEKKLNELGVYSFEQIASWDATQELWIGTKMAFPKRVTKEEWVKQAKELLKNK